MAEVKGAGPEKKVLDFKTGQGFEWVGLRPDEEPQDVPPNVPRQLTNMRLVGGRIETRGGQSLLQELDGAVMGMDDFTPTYRPLVYSSQSGTKVMTTYDPTQSPLVQTMVSDVTHGGNPAPMAIFGEDLYYANRPGFAGQYGSLYKIRNVRPPYGTDSSDITAGSVGLKVWTVPQAYNVITALGLFDGYLFIAVTNDAETDSAIFKYDGISVVRELDVDPIIHAFGTFRETLVAFNFANNDPANNFIRVRTRAGVWSTVSGPALQVVAAVGDFQTVSYRDRLYFLINRSDSASGFLWRFDGSSITDMTAATLVPVGSGLRCIEKGNGYLYYPYEDAVDSVFLGRFDGTTWDPIHKDLTSLVGYSQIRNARIYNGSLHLIADTADGIKILVSDGENTAGDWSVIDYAEAGSDYSVPSSSVVF